MYRAEAAPEPRVPPCPKSHTAHPSHQPGSGSGNQVQRLAAARVPPSSHCFLPPARTYRRAAQAKVAGGRADAQLGHDNPFYRGDVVEIGIGYDGRSLGGQGLGCEPNPVASA